MVALFSLVKRWWRPVGKPQRLAVPCAVACRCGQPWQGQRQDTFQVVTCPRCQKPVFILGASPLPPLVETFPAAPPTARWSHLTPWLTPLAAVALTIVLLVGVYFLWVVPWLFPKRHQDMPESAQEAMSPVERLRQARQHMGQGHFRLAAQVLQGPLGSNGLSLDGGSLRQWHQLQREAALLADLLTEPLEDVLRHAAGVAEAEWQADFPHRFEGKAVLFDAEVARHPDGRVTMAYQLRLGGELAHVQVSDLQLFRDLNLDPPRRLLFGARLASVRLEPPGPTWVVRFQPASGVWLTDPAAALCCPAWGDAETKGLLEDQAGWVK